jgi:hypothetical protein
MRACASMMPPITLAALTRHASQAGAPAAEAKASAGPGARGEPRIRVLLQALDLSGV